MVKPFDVVLLVVLVAAGVGLLLGLVVFAALSHIL